MQPSEYDELEQLIAGLPKRQPSQMLDNRIEATLREANHEATPQSSQVLWLRACAVAATVTIAGLIAWAVFFHTTPPSTETTSRLVEKQRDPSTVTPSENGTPSILTTGNYTEPYDLTWSRDIGEQQRYTPSGKPYRAVVRETVQQRAWHNPETGETLQFNVPSRELVVIKQSTF